MKTSKILSLISCSLFSLTTLSAFADSMEKICHEKGEKLYCGKGEVDKMNYMGNVSFNGTTVLGHTKILGDVDANHSNFNTLDITGDFKADSTSIKGSAKILGDIKFNNMDFKSDTNIVGDLKARNVKFSGNTKIVGDIDILNGNFENNLVLASIKASFTDSTTKNIEFTSARQSQSVYLISTVVNGNIKFHSNNGIVYIGEGSTVNGEIIGGKLVKQ